MHDFKRVGMLGRHLQEPSSSDPLYQYDEGPIAVTSTTTPLKNKLHGSRHISSACSKRLETYGHNVWTCILTRETTEMGSPIERSHMIPQASTRREVRQCEWLLGYKAGTFHLDSHFNMTYMVEDWHTTFDARKWVLVPDKPSREAILQSLINIKNKMATEISLGAESLWPHFETVYSMPDDIYRYRFVNICMKAFMLVYDPPNQPQVVDPNSDHHLLTLQSHIHPLHVIINGRSKIEAWLPTPRDSPTVEIINEMRAIYEVWDSFPMTDEFRDHGRKESDVDHSSLGPPPQTRSRSGHSGSLGKRSERDEDSGGNDGEGRGRAKQRSRGAPADDLPSLGKSCSSREGSVDSFPDVERMDSIKIWQDSLACHTQTFAPLETDDCQGIRTEFGSPKVTGYNGWKPLWDRRWADTSSFSSNDWAYYHNTCNLTAGYHKDH